MKHLVFLCSEELSGFMVYYLLEFFDIFSTIGNFFVLFQFFYSSFNITLNTLLNSVDILYIILVP